MNNGEKTTTHPQSWMISDLQGMQGVRAAIVATGDGLVITRSDGIGRDEADRLAANICGLVSLARAANEHADGRPLSQIACDYEGVMLLVTSVGQARNAVIGALTDPGADLGLVGSTMATMAPNLVGHLDVADRSARTSPVR
ncbi:roadblock/LC7 domain-containing protein [Streptomyces rubiginosohelvolus]|uniref:roadblock/LC7 domain-containing protein n=1 Tax=Streptomyces rubiginosohelvolus TaxID=67362 RepID=UPI0036CFF64F